MKTEEKEKEIKEERPDRGGERGREERKGEERMRRTEGKTLDGRKERKAINPFCWLSCKYHCEVLLHKSACHNN